MGYKWDVRQVLGKANAMNGNLWFHWLDHVRNFHSAELFMDSLALIKDTAVSPCIAHATEAACHT